MSQVATCLKLVAPICEERFVDPKSEYKKDSGSTYVLT